MPCTVAPGQRAARRRVISPDPHPRSTTSPGSSAGGTRASSSTAGRRRWSENLWYCPGSQWLGVAAFTASCPSGTARSWAHRARAPPQPAAARASSASSTFRGWSAAFATRRQCLATVPSGATMTVERITPTVFFPYIVFSPHAP